MPQLSLLALLNFKVNSRQKKAHRLAADGLAAV